FYRLFSSVIGAHLAAGAPSPLDQPEEPFRRAAEDGLARQPSDRALDQGGVPGHGADQLVVRLLAGEAELGIRGIPVAQQLAGRDAQQAQNLADLAFGERLAGVFAVAVGNGLLVQQGDRLAAGSSGAGANELDRFGGLAHGEPPFVRPASYDAGRPPLGGTCSAGGAPP